MLLQYDPDLLNSFDSNPKRHLNYAARYSRSESLVDEEDSMLSHEAQPWNADLEGVQIVPSTCSRALFGLMGSSYPSLSRTPCCDYCSIFGQDTLFCITWTHAMQTADSSI